MGAAMTKTHTTNYFNTLIAVAADCPAQTAQEPPAKADAPSVARLQYALLSAQPYTYTSDDLIWRVTAQRRGLPETEWPQARQAFFANGQPCLRTSPLAKRYGWGLHADAAGRVALVARESADYTRLQEDAGTTQLRAMRNGK